MKELITLTIDSADCPVASAFKLIEGKWKLPILWILTMNGTLRYQDLKKCIIGITNTMLTSSLKELEEDGLIDRIQYNEMPPRVEYTLSKNGNKLMPVLDEVAKWGMDMKFNKNT